MRNHHTRTQRCSTASIRTVAVLALAALALMGLAGTASAKTTWLCKPGKKPDPCTADRTTTVVTFKGITREESIQKPVKGKPAVDCFYVYPTVSEQLGPNANLEIEPTDDERTRLVLLGSYQPPLRRLGASIDRLALHTVATTTVHGFLTQVTASLQPAAQTDATPTPAPAPDLGGAHPAAV